MIKILMHGCNGRMGQMISGLVRDEEEMMIAAGVDTYQGVSNEYPVFGSIDACDDDVDVVIDFSNAAAADAVMEYCAKRQIPLVFCTTGLSEKHHNQKLDAPSGTALALADSINEAMDGSYVYTYDRSQVRRKREKKEIGISAVRGGTIVGEHEVLFAGLDEVIELKHTAYSRSVFGKGAVEAARFLAGKPAGMYDMSDVIGLE